MSGPIIAMGGAEFTMRAENEALHGYVVRHAPRRESGTEPPRICLLPTASGDPREQIDSFCAAMDRRGYLPSSISLFRLGERAIDLRAHLLEQDIIYVTGGNMVNLMALWREHGIDRILTEAHQRGIVLCGYSAGSMCWFEHGVSRGVGRPVLTNGIGLLPGSHCVHYSLDPPRREAYRSLIAAGTLPAGLALDDHAAALFRDGELVETVRSRENAGAFRVALGPDGDGGAIQETRLSSRLLAPPPGPREEPALREMREMRAFRDRAGTGGSRGAIGRGGAPR